MNWGHWREHTDFLRTILNTIILVSGAAGSIITLVKGNNIPILISLVVFSIILIFVLVEIKDRRDKRKGDARTVEAIKATATPPASGDAAPFPVVLPQQGVESAPRVYRAPGGRLVLRLVAPAGRCVNAG